MKLLLLLGGMLLGPAASAQAPSGPIVVYNAGSLAQPFRDLLAAFVRLHPGVKPMQESSGSLEAARKLTELGKIPDVIGVADYSVIVKLLMPKYTTWYLTFASNAMVLAYTDRSSGAGEISAENWWRILLRPGVRWGHSDPRLDPNGYRAQMVFQLAETYYNEAGLSRRLEGALRPRFVRPNEAQLTGLLQAGELDYAWSYQSLARSTGLRWVTLPPDLDLSDPARAARYAAAEVVLPPSRAGTADSIRFRGEPIVYALSIPHAAPNAPAARAFVRFVLSRQGQDILQASGFRLLAKPSVVGKGEGAAGLLP